MSELTVAIPYEPQSYQQEIESDNTRFKVVVIGRRGGKTEMAINLALDKAMNKPGRYWIVAPSYKQVKSIVWVRLKTLLRNDPHWKFNEVELSATHTILNTVIELKGADNEDSLRGVGLDGVVLDECAVIKHNAWTEIIRPMLADSQGWSVFISTPKGKNWFYEAYMLGLDDKTPSWKSWQYPTRVNAYIPEEEIEQAKKDMPERIFRQEIEAEFLDSDTSVFRGIRNCSVGSLKEPIEGRFYYMGIDLGKHQDFTVLTVMDAVNREVVAHDRFNQISWNEQKNRIQYLANKYNNAICWVDASGVGDPIVEDLRMSNVAVEPYKFTYESKIQIIENLQIAIEQRQIIFPAIEVLKKELMEFECRFTQGKRPVYSAPEGKHDDCVTSLALAVWGIKSYIRAAQVVVPRKDEERVVDRQGMGELVHSVQEGKTTRISGY